jgi:hypothetical protein
MYYAADLVAPGGPSAPVWTLLGIIVLACAGILREQIKAKAATREAATKAAIAARDASQAKANTSSLGNGFSGDVLRRLDHLQVSLDNHLEYHLKKEQ